MNDPNSAPEWVQQLVRQAEAVGASDIHLQMTGQGAEVAFRLDGVMASAGKIPDEMAERVFGRIKYLARLKTYQDSLPQDGRIDRSDLQAQCDLRVATYPTITGEKIVLRLFHARAGITLPDLELPQPVIEPLQQFLRGHGGLLLLTGPAGSGKTTTIYACLKHLSQTGGRHVITVEDPVEQVIPGIMQTEVNEAVGLTFAKAARHLLRQDPQVLVLGEIRDSDTAGLAVQAALTGHLVISTLHAGSCQEVFERLFNLCPDRQAVITSVAMIVNQRLMRKLCRHCQGGGCDQCLQTGYLGRSPVVEWYVVNEERRRHLRQEGIDSVQASPTLIESARELCLRGLSNQAEYERLFGL